MALHSVELLIVRESVIGWWSGYLQLDSDNSLIHAFARWESSPSCVCYIPLPFHYSLFVFSVGGQGMCTPTLRDAAALRTGQEQRTVATGSFVALDPK